MIEVSSTAAFARALSRAASVELATYQVRPDSPLARSLERAAQRGADVHVWVDGEPYGDPNGAIARASRAAAREMERDGVHVDVVTERAVHIKAALVDGAAFLDDRNWTAGGHDTIVASTEPDDVALVRDAIEAGRAGNDGHLATGKREALALEAAVIASAPALDGIDVASESFGASGGPYRQIVDRASLGARVRLIVSDTELRGPNGERERRTLGKLRAAGIEIRVGSAHSGTGNEKLCVAGDEAWTGSANMSFGTFDASDWGVRTSDPQMVGALRERFTENWLASAPYLA